MIGSLPGNFRDSLKRFRNDKEYGELIRTSFFALLVRMTGVVAGFFVTLITTRYFGAEALGVVSICLAILSFSSVFGKLGLDIAMLKYIASLTVKNNFPGIKGLYLSALKIIVPVSLLISLLLYLLAPWMSQTLFHKPNLEELLKLNAWFTLPLVLLLINSECIRALKKISVYTFLQTVAVSIFAVTLLIVASFFIHEKYIPVKIQFVSITIAGLLSTALWFRFSRFFKEKATKEISTSNLLSISSAMFTTTLMQLMMSWAGTLILAAYASESEVGIYNALVRISIATNITILAVNSLALPRFAQSFASKLFMQMKEQAEEASRIIFLTSLPIFFLLLFFPHWILSVFGKEFPGNETALYILLAGQFIVCFSGLPSQILNMAGKQHVLRNIAIFSAILNILACFLFIPEWGITGACYAQLIGIFSWNLLSNVSVKRNFGFYVFFKFKFRKD